MRGLWGRQTHAKLFVGVSVGLLLAVVGIAGAASPNISKSFESTGTVPVGSLVALSADKTDTVELANTDNASRLLGIAVDSNDSLLSEDETSGKAQIATDGSVSTLVSTLGGDIKSGDQIGASPFDGIGMKATAGSRVIGLAQASFDDSTAGTVDRQVTDKSGNTKSIKVGYVRVTIELGTNAEILTDNLNSLQKAARSVTGRTVPTYRVIAALTVLTITFLVLVTLIYSSIYGSIVSIGRNPLAKYSVFRALGSVLSLALAITLIGGLVIVLLLL